MYVCIAKHIETYIKHLSVTILMENSESVSALLKEFSNRLQ